MIYLDNINFLEMMGNRDTHFGCTFPRSVVQCIMTNFNYGRLHLVSSPLAGFPSCSDFVTMFNLSRRFVENTAISCKTNTGFLFTYRRFCSERCEGVYYFLCLRDSNVSFLLNTTDKSALTVKFHLQGKLID